MVRIVEVLELNRSDARRYTRKRKDITLRIVQEILGRLQRRLRRFLSQACSDTKDGRILSIWSGSARTIGICDSGKWATSSPTWLIALKSGFILRTRFALRASNAQKLAMVRTILHNCGATTSYGGLLDCPRQRYHDRLIESERLGNVVLRAVLSNGFRFNMRLPLFIESGLSHFNRC